MDKGLLRSTGAEQNKHQKQAEISSFHATFHLGSPPKEGFTGEFSASPVPILCRSDRSAQLPESGQENPPD